RSKHGGSLPCWEASPDTYFHFASRRRKQENQLMDSCSSLTGGPAKGERRSCQLRRENMDDKTKEEDAANPEKSRMGSTLGGAVGHGSNDRNTQSSPGDRATQS